MRLLLALAFACIAFFAPQSSKAHALDPGYLELSPMGEGRWRVSWRVPDVNGRPMPLSVALPDGCDLSGMAAPSFDGRAWITAGVATCADGLAGGTLGIDGLDRTRTDVLVRYDLTGGQPQTHRLTAGTPGFTIPADPDDLEVLTTYVQLGVSHILEGLDHLLFVLALVFLVADTRRLLWTVTAFTLAHSITLAAATLDLIALPPAPVEVVIALSIVFLAYELALPAERRDPVAQRYPALISFGFGLVHGFGFAGALREIGLPQSDVPLALLAFNIGVELGQILFIAAVLTTVWAARRLVPAIATHAAGLTRLASYGIGSVAALWVIERMSGF